MAIEIFEFKMVENCYSKCTRKIGLKIFTSKFWTPFTPKKPKKPETVKLHQN